MASDSEIMRLWDSLPKAGKKNEAILHLYRSAEKAGKQEALSDLENELISDSTIEAALETLRFGRRTKYTRAGIITQRAILKEAFHIAAEKTKTRD